MNVLNVFRKSLLGLACAGAALSAQADLITNGSFSAQPTGNGWQLTNSCAGLDGYMWTNFASDAAHGNYVRLNECGNAGTNPTVRQTVSGLTVGASYQVRWDMMLYENGTGFGTGKSFGLFLGDDTTGQSLYMTELSRLYAWQTFTATFVATGTTATLTFAGELDARTPNGPGRTTDVAYGIDNVSLNAVPEPASLALVAVAGLGLGLARRRSRRA